MNNRAKIFLAFIILVFSAGYFFGQYREYHLSGLVIGSQDEPVAGAEIILQEASTSRNYRVKTDKNGRYVLSGLPHGKYKVTVKRDGYETRTFDWDFSAPQERMQKVEIEPIALATGQQVKLVVQAKEAQQLVAESMEKIKKGDLEEALNLLSELAKNYPDDSNVCYLLGLTLGRLQRYQEALIELIRVTERVPEFSPAYLQLGYCYQNLKEMDKALDYYKKAAELDPSNAANLYNLGLILFEKNKIDEALGYFEQALAVKPDDADTLEMIGRCYINKEDWRQAVDFLKKAREVSQDEEKMKILDKFIASLEEQIKN
ncbi:MAG: tetratricopeptide repeat protein [Acidobacteriota bacterium]|nr:tetratricopeptide repeat protein [Acidobacteriota bacterium]